MGDHASGDGREFIFQRSDAASAVRFVLVPANRDVSARRDHRCGNLDAGPARQVLCTAGLSRRAGGRGLSQLALLRHFARKHRALHAGNFLHFGADRMARVYHDPVFVARFVRAGRFMFIVL